MDILIILACSLLEVLDQLLVIPHPYGDVSWSHFEVSILELAVPRIFCK